MNILFLHRNFPAQFKHIAPELAKNPENRVIFITENDTDTLPNIEKIIYSIGNIQENNDDYLFSYKESISHAKAAAEKALELKNKGFTPDIIYAHSWGQAMFMKDVFPNVPLLCYFEWYYNAEGADFSFSGQVHDETEKSKLRCRNSGYLIDLCSCDGGICPTNWQLKQFPKEFQNKIKIIHDGIDTEQCKADKTAKFTVNENLTLTPQDEVITYATRGLEAYRGFPNFMIAIETLLKKRPNAHAIIAGEDEVFYGSKINGTTYKKMMLEKLDLDMSRVHFVDKLPYDKYIKLLQISSAHVYLTYPFVLSWSLIESMACESPIIASSTEPVVEVIKDNENGLLVDFYNITQLVSKIEYALDNKEKMQQIRTNARKTVLDKYSLKKLLPKQIEYIKSFIKS